MRVEEVLTSTGQTRYVVADASGNDIVLVVYYLRWLDTIGRAPNTLRAYAYDLATFHRYLDSKRLDYRHVTLDDMGDFVRWLKTPSALTQQRPRLPVRSPRSNKTINRCIQAVAGWYDYLLRHDDLARDMRKSTHALRFANRAYKDFLHHLGGRQKIEQNLLRQKVEHEPPKTITKAQVATLIAACNNPRDRLLLHLLFETAMRDGEARALWLADIDIGASCLHVRDRGELINRAAIKTPASIRSIPISRQLMTEIIQFMARFHDARVKTNHLFFTLEEPHFGKPLSAPAVNDLFHRLERKTGIHATPHTLRRSSLTCLALSGMPPEFVRLRAGHAQYQTTVNMYFQPNSDAVRTAWEHVEAQMRLSL